MIAFECESTSKSGTAAFTPQRTSERRRGRHLGARVHSGDSGGGWTRERDDLLHHRSNEWHHQEAHGHAAR